MKNVVPEKLVLPQPVVMAIVVGDGARVGKHIGLISLVKLNGFSSFKRAMSFSLCCFKL